MSENCDCCAGTQATTPAAEINPPEQTALNYRVGTHASFLETMLARLSSLSLSLSDASGEGSTTLQPLNGLTTREPSDPSIALLDAWATVADVLSFYQERIANEGYLPTAQQRRSVLELSRLIGYRPRPGVSASVRLAFTVAAGFDGTIPAGTGAQSIPGTGETPQYFETSADLDVSDQWNTLAPRLTRPQLITPAGSATDTNNVQVPLVTGADVIDTVYLDGISNNLKPGDALFFIFGPNADPTANPPQQYLRLITDVDVQAQQQRTEVTLSLQANGRSAAQELQLYVDKANILFAGSDLAQQVVALLQPVITNITDLSDNPYYFNEQAAFDQSSLLQSAMARVTLIRGVAVQRGFTRIAAWLKMLLRAMQWMSLGRQSVVLRFFPILLEHPIEQTVGAKPLARDMAYAAAASSQSDYGGPTSLAALPQASHPSPLANLGTITSTLGLAPSRQPANALRLSRSVANSFTPQSDLAPRLIAALHPNIADTLYPAWSAIATPAGRVEVHAARVKAGLFAASWAGPATVSGAAGTASGVSTSFANPTISTAWSNSLPSLSKSQISELPLDAAYELIKPGSWVAIDRPALDGSGTRTVTYHVVESLRTANLAAGAPVVGANGATSSSNTGYAAKVSLLTLDPPWLSDLGSSDVATAIGNPAMLRETIVHAQSEPLTLTEEPLDADIDGDSIDLAKVYDGLEPGRWVIVSGTRTDIPGVSGVTASELAMIAGVVQGAQAPSCALFPNMVPPFEQVYYTTDANAYGDRLVVGQLSADALGTPPSSDSSAGWQPAFLGNIAAPALLNQQFCDQVELAPGVYANAYVPSADECSGNFSTFSGLLVDPNSNVPYSGGQIPWSALSRGVYAWRVSSQALHTILNFAAPLAYSYDRASITIYGNVIDATNGQSTGEVLGNGDATQSFQVFPLSQSPLTYVSAATASGAVSTLDVSVNELEWQELDQLAGAVPNQRCYVTKESDAQKTSVTFGNGVHGARLPTGSSNVKATYRYGIGSGGNVLAGQISQLATHPLGAQGVINPLPASGGADPDSINQARANAPIAVMALDRLVSVRDYADFARSYAGIGKAVAARLSDGRQQLVHVSIAGVDDIPIDPGSDLYNNLLASLRRYGDPYLPVAVDARRVRLLVVAANVALLPDYAWEDVEPNVRNAVLAQFAFDARSLGQSAFLSEAIGVMQGVEGVAYVNVTTFDSVGQDVSAAALAALGSTLRLRSHVLSELAQMNSSAASGSAQSVTPAELVYMTPDIPGTLILSPASA